MNSIRNSTEVVLSARGAPSAQDLELALKSLAEFEVDWRKRLGRDVPDYSTAAAKWALGQLYQATQFLVFRELPQELMATQLTVPCPAVVDVATIYSVDLVFRSLPDVVRLARASNSADPLVQHLLHWANLWPLSSVGISGVQPDAAAVNTLLTNPALTRLYIDRIIATGDLSRMDVPQVCEQLRVALGDCRELCPEIYDALHHSRSTIEQPAVADSAV